MPGVEAHGAYAFCALGCLSIIDSPHRIIPKYVAFFLSLPLSPLKGYTNSRCTCTKQTGIRYLNVPRLLSWLSARQYAPEGGFSGRTNKLVDGCYCHWVGGCWPLIEAALGGPLVHETHSADDSNKPEIESLFSRNGMIRYALSCCQDMSVRGGLRDKPSK